MRTADFNPKSITYFPSLHSSKDTPQFAEALGMSLMPYQGRSEKHAGFSAEFQGKIDDKQRAMQACGSLDPECNYHERRAPAELICGAIDKVGMYLAENGWSVYEILRDTNDHDYIFLNQFPTANLYKIGKTFLQIVPIRDWGTIGQKYAAVPVDEVWSITFPRDLGGRKKYRKILSGLSRFDVVGPRFWMKDLEEGHYTGLDTTAYHKLKRLEEARLTRSLGWHLSDYQQQYTTEFYFFYRTVTLHWAQAILREHIIGEMNRLLERLQIECRIVVSGLPMPDAILHIRKELVQGKLQFREACDMSEAK